MKIFGQHDENTLNQIKKCAEKADHTVLCADGHLGYGVPIGGVVAYKNAISPTGVGFDIACGNKAVLTNACADDVQKNISTIMDDLYRCISFGVGRNRVRDDFKSPHDHELFSLPEWEEIEVLKEFKDKARSQLGTVGSGNHYVDIFIDEQKRVWIGVHFGSRGIGHKTASYFLKQAGAKDGMDVDPCILDVNSDLGAQYIKAMEITGKYAYAGRDWVCSRVAHLLGANILEEVHNHHNFAWKENHHGEDYWVVRKGATPAFPGQKGFIGGSMGDISVIIEGIDSKVSKEALYSTVHGAGRVMSRTKASGRKKWKRDKNTGRKAQLKLDGGLISHEMMHNWVNDFGVELRGAGTDESPHCYRRLPEVLEYHKDTIKILHTLKPIGVAMAGENEFDPYKD